MLEQVIEIPSKKQPNALLVHQYAGLAAAVATGTSFIPAPIAIAANLAGVDPYTYVQQDMVESFSKHCGRDLSFVIHRRPIPATGHELAQTSRGIVRKVVSFAHRARATAVIARRSVRYVPIAGAVLFGGYAYWETWDLGMACLTEANIEEGGE
jgi:hypothetical protein